MIQVGRGCVNKIQNVKTENDGKSGVDLDSAFLDEAKCLKRTPYGVVQTRIPKD